MSREGEICGDLRVVAGSWVDWMLKARFSF